MFSSWPCYLLQNLFTLYPPLFSVIQYIYVYSFQFLLRVQETLSNLSLLLKVSRWLFLMHSSPALIFTTKAIKIKTCYLKYLYNYICDNPAYFTKCPYESLRDLEFLHDICFNNIITENFCKFLRVFKYLILIYPSQKRKKRKILFLTDSTVIFPKVRAPKLFLRLECAFLKGAPWW